MLLRVEAIAARTPLCSRDQAIRLVIAYLLHTDVSSQGEIVGTQRETSCHVKLPSALRDFFQATRFFLPHRTSTLSLSRSLNVPIPTRLDAASPSSWALVLYSRRVIQKKSLESWGSKRMHTSEWECCLK